MTVLRSKAKLCSSSLSLLLALGLTGCRTIVDVPSERFEFRVWSTQVVDPAGAPLSDYRVVVSPVPGSYDGPDFGYTAFADASGWIEFLAPSGVPVTLQVRSLVFEPEYVYEFDSLDELGRRLVYRPTRRAGRLMLPDGFEVEENEMVLEMAFFQGGLRRPVDTGQRVQVGVDGFFEYKAADEFRLDAILMVSNSDRIRVESRQLDLDLPLSALDAFEVPWRRLELQINNPAVDFPDFRGRLVFRSPGSLHDVVFEQLSLRSGLVEFFGTPGGGELRLESSVGMGPVILAPPRWVTLSDSEALEVEVELHRLDFFAQDGAGLPVVDASICYSMAWDRYGWCQDTDLDGRVTLFAAPGDYLFTAQHPAADAVSHFIPITVSGPISRTIVFDSVD